jgi:hypothetical protein
VLRLLAVYLGAAGISLFLVRRYVSPVRAPAMAALVLCSILLTGRALLTASVYAPLDMLYDHFPFAALRAELQIGGIRNSALGDVVYQEIPWRKSVREAAKNGQLPLWNRFLLAGEPLLAMQQPQVFQPTTWPGFLLPLASAWTFEMSFRFFVALLTAYLFLRELECGEGSSMVGAAGWAFSDFLVFYSGYPLSTAAAPFPLLLLGLRRLARDTDRRALALTVAAMMLIIVAGHPETLLHSVALAGIFFLFELAWADPPRRVRAVGLSLAAGVLALGLGAVLLLPFYEAAQQTIDLAFRRDVFAKLPRALPLHESLERLSKEFVPYAFGELGRGESGDKYVEPAGYAGSILFPLALLGLGSRRREKWPLVIAAVVGLAGFAQFPWFADALTRLPLFGLALNTRMAFAAAFSVAALAALGVERLRKNAFEAAPWFVAACLGAFLVLGYMNHMLLPRLSEIRMTPAELRRHAIVQVLPLALAGFGAWILGRRHYGGAAAGLMLLLLLSQRRLEEAPVYPTLPAASFYPRLPLLDAIPRDQPWRTTAVGYALVPNVSAMYELEDVRGYEAMTFRPLVETFPLWCVAQPVWYNRVDDATRPFLSFLNVRYVVFDPRMAAPVGWKVLASDSTGFVAENPNVLPRVFVPREIVHESDPAKQVDRLRTVTDFAAVGVVAGPDTPAARNGDARVAIAKYSPQALVLDVDAREPAVVATSITRWPGWRLTVDGKEASLLCYNRAFLAFEVLPGRHRAVLRYWPRSFAAGLWISALSLAVAVAIFGRRSASAARASARSSGIGANVLAADHSIQSDASGTGSR